MRGTQLNLTQQCHKQRARWIAITLLGIGGCGLHFCAAGQELVRLTCSGTQHFQQDGRERRRENVAIDIAIDTEARKAVIEGSWGCALMLVDEKKCVGVLDVAITDEVVSYSATADDGKYRGVVAATLSRYSGVFRATSSVLKKVPDEYWVLFAGSAELQCTKAKKLF